MGHEIAIGMNQRSLLCNQEGRRAHVHPSPQEATLQLAESYLTRTFFRQILGRIVNMGPYRKSQVKAQGGETRTLDSGSSELPSLKSGWESTVDATLHRLCVLLEPSVRARPLGH